jgi:hypothetical protein
MGLDSAKDAGDRQIFGGGRGVARPAGGRYKLADGTIVPSVTTILGRFKNCGPLMHWSWSEGIAGRNYRETRDKAAGIGTLAHALVEHQWRNPNEVFDWEPVKAQHSAEDIEKARKAFGAYEEWARQTNLQVVEGEMPLVSEQYRFGGTLDAIMVAGKLSLGDWKTSSGIYGEYLIQCAAYGQLWTENFPDRPITGGFHLLRFDKQHGDFEHRYYADLSEAWEAFRLMIPLYKLMGDLDKRAR